MEPLGTQPGLSAKEASVADGPPFIDTLSTELAVVKYTLVESIAMARGSCPDSRVKRQRPSTHEPAHFPLQAPFDPIPEVAELDPPLPPTAGPVGPLAPPFGPSDDDALPRKMRPPQAGRSDRVAARPAATALIVFTARLPLVSSLGPRMAAIHEIDHRFVVASPRSERTRWP